MRLVLQRVSRASVTVLRDPQDERGETVGEIGAGLLVLAGVGHNDDAAAAARLARKTAELRIFPDDAGRFNRSLLDSKGEALVVSQFTLYGDVRRGRRPGFTDAAPPELAEPVVEAYARALEALGVSVARGRFGARMQVSLVNDGPVTIVIDSEALERPRRAT